MPTPASVAAPVASATMIEMDLTTARLILRGITPATAAAIVAGTPGPGDAWHPDYPFADELDPLRSLAQTDATAVHPVFRMYQVRRAVDDLAVGGIGFFGPPDESGTVEIGYGLVEAARGNGFAAEAVAALVATAFAHGASGIVAETTEDNRASQLVLERSGFELVGRPDDVLVYQRTAH